MENNLNNTPINETTPTSIAETFNGSNENFRINATELNELQGKVEAIKNQIQQVIVGQDAVLEFLIASLLVGGHVLIEGMPGIAKTLMAKLLAATLDTKYSRIQFTPDLMPTDVLGTSVFNVKTSDFQFNRGPIFSNVILIDEINRSPAKTQAALFEVMEELHATVDGIHYEMDFPFMVIATQNPVEQEGTYRLPEAQLDRFLFRIKVNYPSLIEEQQIIHRFKDDFYKKNLSAIKKVLTPTDLARYRNMVERIFIKDDLVDYIAQVVYQTRNNADLFLGASPRASLAILKSSKAMAAIRGREFATPDDIKDVAYMVLNHRIILTPEKEMEGVDSEMVIKTIIEGIEIPR
jgi:MoxR-like ATPase